MSISFQSTSASTASRENAAVVAAAANAAAAKMRFPPPVQMAASQHGVIHPPNSNATAIGFPPQQQVAMRLQRERKLSRPDENGRSTEV